MPKTIILAYPDTAPYRRIVDDVDAVVRGIGGRRDNPTVMVDEETEIGAALIQHLAQQGEQSGAAETVVPGTSFLVEDGVTFQAGDDLMVMEITDSQIMSWAVAPRTGDSAFGWCEETSATNPVVTAAMATKADGSSYVYFYGGYSSNNSAPTDSKGNTLTAEDSSFYVPYGSSFQSRSYSSLDAAGGAGHSVSFLKNDVIAGEVSVAVIEAINTDTIQGGVTYVTEGDPVVSASVTVDRPAVLVAAWFGDAGSQNHTAVPTDSGFEVKESLLALPPNLAVQCAFATKEVGPGTHDIEWDVTPPQGGALYLYALTSSNYP